MKKIATRQGFGEEIVEARECDRMGVPHIEVPIPEDYGVQLQ